MKRIKPYSHKGCWFGVFSFFCLWTSLIHTSYVFSLQRCLWRILFSPVNRDCNLKFVIRVWDQEECRVSTKFYGLCRALPNWHTISSCKRIWLPLWGDEPPHRMLGYEMLYWCWECWLILTGNRVWGLGWKKNRYTAQGYRKVAQFT